MKISKIDFLSGVTKHHRYNVLSNIDTYRIHLRKRKESEIYMKLIKQIPSEDGFYMPGEFEPHQGCILIWPKRPGSWGYEAKAAGMHLQQ